MRHNPKHFSDDPEVVKQLVRENPWGILVSDPGQLVASHYPLLLDECSDDLAFYTHVGRPDEELHELGTREILVIVQGVHGYISPSWYAPGAIRAPTWNFSVAHCYGVPRILGEDENLSTLARLVEHFERHVDEPMLLDRDWAAPIARGTVGLRIPVTRFECKLKMSQDKDPQSRRQVLEALRRPGRYQNVSLAQEMERALADYESG